MRLAASNIGWKSEYDTPMYQWFNENGIQGLEIAPTRVFPNDPYDDLKSAKIWAESLKDEYDLDIVSMQSIWYGRKENIFSSSKEREILTEYTKRAMDFAQAIGCKNLVFGCPRNRNVEEGADVSVAEDFFGSLGDYAYHHDTVLAMEANPSVYNTNYCNTTDEAANLVRTVDSPGFKLNLDIGTILTNDEDISIIKEYVDIINHVHISEPGLALIGERDIHCQLRDILLDSGYDRYVSLEVKTQDDMEAIKGAMQYIKSIFGSSL